MNIPPEQLQEIDLPEVMETFSDSLGVSSLDSQSARLTFCVRRMQPPKQGKPPLFKQYPVCRLVMPVSGLVDLSNQLNQLMAGLEKMGLVKVTPGKPAEAIDKTKIN